MPILTCRLILAVALLAIGASPCASQQIQQRAEPYDSLPAYLVEGIVVTSRRAPELRSNLAQQIQVVTRAELDRTAAGEITEALKKNEPLDVIQYPGLLAGVGIRGFRPQISGINPRTLILLDGRPAAISNLATLDLGAVERIEVVRGPASSLYGSSAMGGVVNVITRSSTGPVSGRLVGRYGSFGQYRSEAGLGGNLAPGLDFDVVFALAGQTQGYRIGSNRSSGAGFVLKTLSDGTTVRLEDAIPDTVVSHSRYSTRSGSVRLGYAPSTAWRFDIRGEGFFADGVQSPGDLTATYDSRSLKDLHRRSGEAAVSGNTGAHTLLVRAFAAHDDASYYALHAESPFVNFQSPTTVRGAQLQDVVRWGDAMITGGIDYHVATARSRAFVSEGVEGAPYNADSRISAWGPFAEARLGLHQNALVATLGARLDRVRFEVEEVTLADGSRVSANSESHAVLNPSAGILFQPGSGVRLHTTLGRAFVTPSAFQVAGYSENAAGSGVIVTRGNPELNPETSISWDVGVGLLRPARGLEADLTYFHTEVRDRIAPRTLPVTPDLRTPGGDPITAVTSYENVDEARIRGIEGGLSYDLGALGGFRRSLRLFGNATLLLAADETLAGTTQRIKNVADRTAVFGLAYDDLRRVGTRVSGRYVGPRVDSDWSDWMNPGDLRYPAFAVFDASASLRLRERYTLGLLMSNLLDQNYYEVRGYNLPGRALQFQAGMEF